MSGACCGGAPRTRFSGDDAPLTRADDRATFRAIVIVHPVIPTKGMCMTQQRMPEGAREGARTATDGGPAGAEAEAFTLPLSLQTLGAARVVLGRNRVVPSNGTLFALLMRVSYSAGLRVRRDELLGLLWPGLTVERQRGNLRQALYKARALGIDITLEGDTVRLNPAQVAVTFSREQTAALFDRDVVRGEEPFGVFLPGYVAPWPELAEWVEGQRSVVHAGVRRVLAEQLRARRERADWTGAERLARWLLQFDALNEDATLTLAECTMLAGSKAEAVAILDRYLEEIGPTAGDIRLPATTLRKRFTDVPSRRRASLAPSERHFVGRATELADLTTAMRRARWHDGSAVLLDGPAGTGKTRLANQLSKVAEIEGFREIRFECREGEANRSLSALREPLSELLELRGAIGCSPESMTVVRRILGVDEEASTAELGPIDVESMEGASASRQLRTLRGQSVQHAVIDLIGAVTEERPLLLVIENLHWIDEDSWAVLRDLSESVNLMRVFLLFTIRSTPHLAEKPIQLVPAVRLTVLRPLLPDESLLLARALSEELAAPLMPNVEEWIVSASEGNPFFLRALMNHWAETGDAGGIPPTLQLLLDQRITRLPSAAVRALQTISLLGTYASLDRIIASLQLPTHELLGALEQLEIEGYLANDDASLVVSHELVGRAATNRMSTLVCAALRSSIADALEAEYLRTQDSQLLLQCLHHIEKSGRADSVIRFLVKHAEPLIEAGRPRGLLVSLSRAVAAKLSGTAPPLVRRLQARLELESGEYAKSLALGSSGLLLPSDLSVISAEHADEALSLVDSAYRADPFVDRDELCEFTVRLAGVDHLPRQLRLRAAEIGLVIASNTCDDRRAKLLYERIAPTQQEVALDDRVERMALLYHTIFGSLQIGESIAKAMFRKAMALPASTTSYQDAGRAAFTLRLCGCIDQAKHAFEVSYQKAIEIEAPRLAQFPAWQLANLYLEENSKPDLDLWKSQLATLFQSEEDEVSSSYIVAFFCRAAIKDRDIESAKSYLEHCKRVYPRFPTVKAHTYLVALELGTCLIDPEWMPSAAILEVARARFDATARFGTSDFFVSAFTEALVRAQRAEEATQLLSNYLRNLRRDKSPHSFTIQLLRDQLNIEP
jgi:DNA-binding SARP family transcriptional activator